MEKAIVHTNHGVHTSRRSDIGHIMQQSRVPRVTMEGYEMSGLGREARERICKHAA